MKGALILHRRHFQWPRSLVGVSREHSRIEVLLVEWNDCFLSSVGRRMFNQSSGELVGQQNPEQPVVKQGHWSQKTDSELYKQDDVELLRVSSFHRIHTSSEPFLSVDRLPWMNFA